MYILVIILPLLLPVTLYLLCIKPNTGRQTQLTPFEKTFIAHRGYFDNDSGCPENSLPAFQKAIQEGYGIELDVQLTKDNQLVVFHDASLNRMCGVKKRVSDCSYKELSSYKLVNTNHIVPLFTDVLELIRGKVPLVIEIKPEGNYIKTAKQLAGFLENYKGIYCIESFHPRLLAWYKRHRPEVLRGQLSTDYKNNKMKGNILRNFILTNLLLNWYSKPDFIAYNHKYANQFSYRLCRKLYPVVNAAWTIRSKAELQQAKSTFSIFIFDSFKPI